MFKVCCTMLYLQGNTWKAEVNLVDNKVKVSNYQKELTTSNTILSSNKKKTFEVSDDSGIIHVQNLTISSAESHYYRYNYFVRVFSEPAIYDEIKVYTPSIKVSLTFVSSI